MPNCGIGVDVIVGFPGETELDFLETYHYLAELDISYLHVFTYSERLDTLAINLKNSVPKRDRSNRSKMLHILSDKKKEQFCLAQKNTIQEVLFESYLNGQILGWTKNYIRFCSNGVENLDNKIVKVHLESFHNGKMNGKIAN